MDIIRFSHNYPKLFGQKSARLLDVWPVSRKSLSTWFVNYDTSFAGGKYPLPDGDYLILFFMGVDVIPFTTVRSATFGKEEYYRMKIGNWFTLEMQ